MILPEYSIRKINDRVYRIRNYMVFVTIIIGDEKVMVIDTGFGKTNLLDFIKENIDIEGKELMVFNTHSHIDHCRGNYAFEKIYLHKNNMIEGNTLRGYEVQEEGVIKNDFKNRYKIEVEGDFIDYSYDHLVYEYIKEGDVFDLGGISFEVIETFGHTTNDISFYFKKEGWLFAADSFDNLIWAYFDNSTTRDEYVELINKVSKLEFNEIYTGHNGRPKDKEFLNILKKALLEVNYEDSVPTPKEDLPNPNLEALDYLTTVEHNGEKHNFKIQYHPTNFL